MGPVSVTSTPAMADSPASAYTVVVAVVVDATADTRRRHFGEIVSGEPLTSSLSPLSFSTMPVIWLVYPPLPGLEPVPGVPPLPLTESIVPLWCSC